MGDSVLKITTCAPLLCIYSQQTSVFVNYMNARYALALSGCPGIDGACTAGAWRVRMPLCIFEILCIMPKGKLSKLKKKDASEDAHCARLQY